MGTTGIALNVRNVRNIAMASKELVMLARKAAGLHSKAAAANMVWVEAFKREYGHDDIDDALVELIDYSTGDLSLVTSDFIEEHSGRGKS
jgi:hypothetical protein